LTEDPDEDQLIFKFITNYTGALQNINKNLAFINNIYSKNPERMAYLESIEDGLLIVYKNIISFQKLNQAIDPQVKMICANILKNESNFLMENVTEDHFPKQGVIITVEYYNHPIEEIFSPLQQFYESMHPQIKLTIEKDNTIKMHFKNFEAFKAYNDILFALTRLDAISNEK
jgi:hypothetical protein